MIKKLLRAFAFLENSSRTESTAEETMVMEVEKETLENLLHTEFKDLGPVEIIWESSGSYLFPDNKPDFFIVDKPQGIAAVRNDYSKKIYLNRLLKSFLLENRELLESIVRHELLHLELHTNDSDPLFIEARKLRGIRGDFQLDIAALRRHNVPLRYSLAQEEIRAD